MASDGLFQNEVRKVNPIIPETPCLWCVGHVSADADFGRGIARVDLCIHDRRLKRSDIIEPAIDSFGK